VSPDEFAAKIAFGQFGLIGQRQALAAGMTRQQILYRLRAGRWETFLPAVYRINGAPSSWSQSAMGSCLWAGDGAALSHSAAARVWGLNGFEVAGVEISTVTGKRNVALPFRVHRVNKPLLGEIENVAHLQVTSVRRTILDLTGIRHQRAERVLDQALARELTTLGRMWLLYEAEWTRGRRGIAILRSQLMQRTPGRGPDDSELEFLLDGIIRDFDLPEPHRQFRISLPEGQLVIEADSYAFHGDRPTFDSDRERDVELQALGWRVLRFTWAQLKWRREWVAGMIARHLDVEW
jgi:hypothetical protein